MLDDRVGSVHKFYANMRGCSYKDFTILSLYRAINEMIGRQAVKMFETPKQLLLKMGGHGFCISNFDADPSRIIRNRISSYKQRYCRVTFDDEDGASHFSKTFVLSYNTYWNDLIVLMTDIILKMLTWQKDIIEKLKTRMLVE